MSKGRVSSVEDIKADPLSASNVLLFHRFPFLLLNISMFSPNVHRSILSLPYFSHIRFVFFLSFFIKRIRSAHICNCVLFNSSGTFHSPDFPLPLGDVHCLFYHFEAPSEHTVHIIFHSFQLPQRRAG